MKIKRKFRDKYINFSFFASIKYNFAPKYIYILYSHLFLAAVVINLLLLKKQIYQDMIYTVL